MVILPYSFPQTSWTGELARSSVERSASAVPETDGAHQPASPGTLSRTSPLVRAPHTGQMPAMAY